MLNSKEMIVIVLVSLAYALFMIIRTTVKESDESAKVEVKKVEEKHDEQNIALNKIFKMIAKGVEVSEEDMRSGLCDVFGVVMTKESDKNIKTKCVITIEKSKIDEELYIVAEFKHNGNITSSTTILGKTNYVDAFKEIHKIYTSFQPNSMVIGRDVSLSRMK